MGGNTGIVDGTADNNAFDWEDEMGDDAINLPARRKKQYRITELSNVKMFYSIIWYSWYESLTGMNHIHFTICKKFN